MSDVAMIIKTKAQPGKRDELYALYQELLAPRATNNSEQTVVVWTDDQADDDTFYLFEIYRSMEALGLNAQAPWFADYLAKAGPLIEAEPEVAMTSPRWAKGISLSD